MAFIAAPVLLSCHKSGPGTAAADNWQLVKKYSAIGASYRELTPGPDSSVLLSLHTDNTYTTRLGNAVVAQGTYSITTDTAYYHQKVLELNNFKTTGLFAQFVLMQVGNNGQVLSTFDGLYMNISHDSLKLNGALTPGGFVSYLFIKRS